VIATYWRPLLFLSMSSSALFRVYPEGHKLKRSVELEVSTRAGSMAHVYVRRQVYLSYVCALFFLLLLSLFARSKSGYDSASTDGVLFSAHCSLAVDCSFLKIFTEI
jgi:hypothetical protein